MHRTWHLALTEFAAHQRAADRSPGTIRLYNYRLVDLAEAHPRGPHTVTYSHLVAALGNPTWRPETRRSVRTAYRSFFRWATRRGHVPEDPSLDLPTIRVPEPMPRPIPEPLMHISLRHAAPREEFMIRLGACGGLRASEIARVEASHWDRWSQILTVLGKGRKTRLVGIADEPLVVMLNALEGVAFPNRWTGQPMTAGHVSKLLSQALAETWTGHTLRHRYGTVAVRGTKDIYAVSVSMGHSNVNTTKIYSRLDVEQLHAVARAAVA